MAIEKDVVMTRDEIRKMREDSPADFNTMVWGRVFGCTVKPVELWAPRTEIYIGPLHYDRDPAADYSVLKLVRETWSRGDKERFSREICALVRMRVCEWNSLDAVDFLLFGNGDAEGIQIGDFAHAAVIVKLEPERSK